jgi:hypothetical protein
MRLRRARVPKLSSRVLASPVYRRIWVSGIIYYSAYWVEIITTGWIVLEITDSPFQVGLSGFCRMLPMLLLGSALGVLADRLRRIDILIAIHAVDLLAALSLALIFMSGIESVWIIYPLVALIGCGWAADFSARRTLIDEVQERALLANSMSLEALSMSGSKIFATLSAGLLLAVGDASLGYWCLTALYGFGLLWLLNLRRQLPMKERPRGEAIRFITAMRSGWSVMMRVPVVRGVFIVTVIINVLVFPYQQLIAIVASDILSVGPFWMGLLASADGVGAIVTGSLLAFGTGPTRQGAFFAGASAATAALLVALALSPIYALSLLIQVGLGVCVGMFGAYQAALVLSATPPESRARALGLIATAIGLTPFGMLFIGGLSSTAGAQAAIATTGSLGLLGLLLVFSLNGSLRSARVAS